LNIGQAGRAKGAAGLKMGIVTNRVPVADAGFVRWKIELE
jgi:hypothetical protein